jgi:WD40 repeat protein
VFSYFKLGCSLYNALRSRTFYGQAYRAAFFLLITLFIIGPLSAFELGALKVKVADGVDSKDAPKLTYGRTIRLGLSHWVQKMAFSPDGRFLAIVDGPQVGSNDVLIWDLGKDKLQARIKSAYDCGNDPACQVEWGPKSAYVTFGQIDSPDGTMHCWDAITGDLLQVSPKYIWKGNFSFDGRKFLAAQTGPSFYSKFRVYNTDAWDFKEYVTKNIKILSMAWAENGQILVLGSWYDDGVARAGDSQADVAIGAPSLKMGDVVARLIDVDRDKMSKMLLLPAVKGVDVFNLSTNGAGNMAQFGAENILDLDKMQMITYCTLEDVKAGRMPATVAAPQNIAISGDGKFLFLKEEMPIFNNSAKNLILNAKTGKPLLWFFGGHRGIAVSPDGKQVAMGDGGSVKLLDLQ